MLLRRSAAWGCVLQGLCARPAAAGVRAGSGTAGSVPGNVEEKDMPAEGTSLLTYWKGLLDERHGVAGASMSNDDVRQLLLTALRLRQGKGQSSVPEQLLSIFEQYYRQLELPEQLAFFRSLTTAFGVQGREVDTATAAWQQLRQQQHEHQESEQQHQTEKGGKAGLVPGPGQEQLLKAAAQLSVAAMPLYSRLFVPLGQQPCGIKFLVDMRADLLRAIQEHPSGAAPLRALSDALRGCLAEWFSVGLLELRRISWEDSSAALLEKVAAGEAVHPLDGWRDLKSRLSPENRRVFAFFHNAMPEEPLVVLHTALTNKVARSMGQLLPHLDNHSGPAHSLQFGSHYALSPTERTWEDQQYALSQHQYEVPGLGHTDEPYVPARRQPFQPQHQPYQDLPPSVAVFYSISATQPGLTGVDLGQFLIKQVAHRVQSEFPSVTTLCTLSPLPGFASWLQLQLARVTQGLPPSAPLLLPEEAEQLEAVAAGHMPAPVGKQEHHVDHQQQQRAAAVLSWGLEDGTWLHSSRLEAALEPVLMRLAAHFLLKERRRGLALDPVANFHLRNGAAVLQLNWHADVSPMGLQRSHGIMVNYHYELDRLHENNRAYLVDGRVPAAAAVEALLLPPLGG